MDYASDETKRQANLAQHGADFADAAGALGDEDNRTLEDRGATGEPR